MSRIAQWLASLLQDVRFGYRMLRKQRVVTAAAVLSMALATGASIAAFSLIDTLILRPLPVHEPSRLVYLVYPRWDGSPAQDTSVSYSLLQQFREASVSQLELFGVGGQGFLRPVVFDDSGGQQESIRAQEISGNAFGVLGVQPALGRVLTPSDDRRHVAVLGYDFWTRRFGRNPAVVGRWVTSNGTAFQIVGIARKGFTGLAPGLLTEVWFSDVIRPGAIANPEAGWSGMWGRLKPGVAPEQARQVLQTVFSNERRDRVKFFPPGTEQKRIDDFLSASVHLPSAAQGLSYLRSGFARPFWILAVVVGLVLLVACSNLANLLLARAAAREREMSVRVAIGAARGRLIRQMLIESTLIGGAACALGLVFSSAVAPEVVNLLAPSDNPAYLNLQADARVVTFTVLLGLLATLLFGMVPALRASAVSPNSAMKSARPGESKNAGVLRPLLSAQVAFSFLVLFAAALLLRSFDKLTTVDLGFSKHRVALFSLSARDAGQPDRLRTAGLQMLDHLRGLPGVESASLSGWALGGGMTSPVWTPSIRIPSHAPEPTGPDYLSVSPGFFQTLRIALLEGREFVPRDTEPENPSSVIVNQSFARLYFPAQSPLGKRFNRIGDSGPIPQQIVGLVRDAKYNNVREPAPPTVYVPLRAGRTATLEVRTTSDSLPLLPGLRSRIDQSHPSFRVAGVILQSKLIDNTLLTERLLALLSAFFATVAVALAAVGLYGTISYSVVRRTREIGIRVALGAERWSVVGVVMRDLALMLIAGLVVGVAAGLALGRFIGSLLFEVKPYDAASLLLALLCLLVTGALAAVGPVLRATRVDPAVALREE